MKVKDRVMHEGKLGYVVEVHRKERDAEVVFYDTPDQKHKLKINELEKVTREE